MTDATDGKTGSAWTRLRRRKVVQWGLIYTAAAWGFLQGLEYVSATYDWPRHIQQYATLAFLIGLPIALVLAWYHGDRGQQRITTPEFAIVTLLLLLGGGVFWYYQRASDAGRTDDAQTANTAQRDIPSKVKDARPSIAVLPFENRSRLEDDAFFVDGIHDDILTQLTKVGALKVIARTSVEQFRDTKLTTREIGEKLGVTKILEGGVQRAGDRVRVTVQLIDTSTAAHLWAESYDRELSAATIFAIQSEVASAIVAVLQTKLTPVEQARRKSVPTRNLAAWEAYQLGQPRMATRSTRTLADAEQFFREAVALDPKFALAYVGLAIALNLQIDYSGVPGEAVLDEAQEAVEMALKLDPDLAEAWAAAGLTEHDRFHYERAETMYRRAIELNRNYATAHHWYSVMLRDVGRADEALVQIQQALELDPLSAILHNNAGQGLRLLGRFAEAEASFRKAITIDPSGPLGYVTLGNLKAYAFNQFADAIPWAREGHRLDRNSPRTNEALAVLYLDIGEESTFEEMIEKAAIRWPDDTWVQINAALVGVLRQNGGQAMQHAEIAHGVDPRFTWALKILRAEDLRHERFDIARSRYVKAYPEFFLDNEPRVDGSNYLAAIDLALVLKTQGDGVRAGALLDGAARVIHVRPRLGIDGYGTNGMSDGFGIADVQILALRGKTAEALAALQAAEQQGWRGRYWRYYRDFEPNLASIRNEPEFKAVFADIERDMAQQRARLAARPKNAPLELTPASR